VDSLGAVNAAIDAQAVIEISHMLRFKQADRRFLKFLYYDAERVINLSLGCVRKPPIPKRVALKLVN
jgi:hypothetical protein